MFSIHALVRLSVVMKGGGNGIGNFVSSPNFSIYTSISPLAKWVFGGISAAAVIAGAIMMGVGFLEHSAAGHSKEKATKASNTIRHGFYGFLGGALLGALVLASMGIIGKIPM